VHSLKQTLDALAGMANPTFDKVGTGAFVIVLALSLAYALLVSALYVYFYGRRSTGSQIHRAFPLLGLSVTAMFICVQFSLPLSLGLLGALSIVRFRTPVKDPEEIGFLMYLIAGSIACATFNFKFLGLIVVAGLAALLLLHFLGLDRWRHQACGTLTVRLDPAARDAAMEILAGLATLKLESCASDAVVSVLTYSFRDLDTDRLRRLNHDLSALAPAAEVSCYFQRGEGGLA